MGKNVTIKWHGKADRGLMDAASTLAVVLAAEGKYVQAFPGFGFKTCGAPATAFNRVSQSPIKLHSFVEKPDVEVVADPGLLKYIDFIPGSTENGENTSYIINTSLTPEFIKEKFNLMGNKIFTLDIPSVSPHIALMTVVINHLELLPIENFKERLKKTLSDKLDNESVMESILIIDRALNEVQGI